MGDAVCSFNPVYGQGMTVGAIEAEALSRAVTEARVEGGIGPDFGRRWFQTIRPVVDAAWNGVRLEDFRFPELAGERPLRLRPLQWYMERVQQATHRSAFCDRPLLSRDELSRAAISVLQPPSDGRGLASQVSAAHTEAPPPLGAMRPFAGLPKPAGWAEDGGGET